MEGGKHTSTSAFPCLPLYYARQPASGLENLETDGSSRDYRCDANLSGAIMTIHFYLPHSPPGATVGKSGPDEILGVSQGNKTTSAFSCPFSFMVAFVGFDYI